MDDSGKPETTASKARSNGGRKIISRNPLQEGRPYRGLQSSRTPEYLVVGHICADLTGDGESVLGGTALYSALAAARLGWRSAVLTRGLYGQEVSGVKIPSLDSFAAEIDIIVQEADSTTMFENTYRGGLRTQRLPYWAGPIDLRGLPPHWRNAKVIHLGPIAQEIDARHTGGLTPELLGLTPQGWMRRWDATTNYRVRHEHLRLPADLVSRTDAMLVSDEEIAHARDTVEAVAARRVSVITLGSGGCRVLYGGAHATVPAYPVQAVDYTGAGDVFAAAFFTRITDRSLSAVNAARYANAVAALALTGVGVSKVPTREEIAAFLDTTPAPAVRY